MVKKCILFTLLFTISVWASKNDSITIYTEHYPPYNMKENGKLTGISVEVLHGLLKQMNEQQRINDIKLTNWSRAYSIAQKKKNAMVFSTTRTQSRENLFKWVGPIITTQVGLIAPKHKNISIKNIQDLNQYKIGAVLKDIGELLLLDLGVNKNNIQSVLGENAINTSFTKMEKNRIDMFAYDTTVSFENAKKEGFDISQYEIIYTLKKAELYFAFNKQTDDAIIQKWQNALNIIKQNGTYDAILKKYK